MAELKFESVFEKNPDCLVLKLYGSLDLFTFSELKHARWTICLKTLPAASWPWI